MGVVRLKVGNEVPSVILHKSQCYFATLGGRKNQKLIQSTPLFVEVMVCTQLIDSYIPCQNITSSTSVNVLSSFCTKTRLCSFSVFLFSVNSFTWRDGRYSSRQHSTSYPGSSDECLAPFHLVENFFLGLC